MNESTNTKLLMSIFDFYGNLINKLVEIISRRPKNEIEQITGYTFKVS